MLSRRLRAQPDFVKLWTGQAISKTGSAITSVGLPLTAVLTLGASPFQMGLLSAAGGAAVLIFGLFAGAWADRLPRRPTLIAADAGRALVLGAVPLFAMLHRLTIGQLYWIAAAGGMLTVLFDAAYPAYVPSLVPRESILEANSALALTDSFAEVAGPGLTGALVQWITAPFAILLDALSFLVSAVSLALIRTPEPPVSPSPDPHMLREIGEGLAACWRNPILRALAARTFSASFFLGFFSSLYMLYAIRELKLDAILLGIVIAVGGCLNVVGALLTPRLARGIGIGPSLILSAIVPGFASLLIPLAHGPVRVCAAFLVLSQLGDIAWPVYNIQQTSLIQSIAPNHLLGRVNSAMRILFLGLIPAGAFVSGTIAGKIGIRQTLFLGSAGFLLSALWLVFSPLPRLRELPQAFEPTISTN